MFSLCRLRTLEFWVDNLNAEFLLPILSRDADLFSDLMMSLTHHLRPAPYQYGLLTLRLLGKLGGKNRLFLQQPMDLPLKMEEICNETTGLQIDCEWSDGSKFFLDIPLERAVYILKSVSSLEQLDSKKISTNNGCSTYGNESSPFFSGASTLEDINIPLLDYKGELLANTRKSQAYSAFVLVQKAISNIVTLLDDQQSPSTQKLTRDSSEIIDGELEKDELHMGRQDAKLRDSFLLACEGLLHAAGIASLKCDALVLIEGLMQQRVMFLSHHVKDICRSGDEMGMNYTFPNISRRKEPTIISGKIQPLSPFGTFVFSGQSEDNMECFIINMTIPKILKNNNATELKVVLSIIDRLVEFTKIVDKQLVRLNADPGGESKEDTAANMACTDIFLENLLHHLCEACMTFTWESRAGVFDCICKLLEHMGTEWARMYEVEMIHLTLFCLKDHPTEITIAEKYAARFHFRILALMYDSVSSNMTAKEFIDDVSLPKRLDDMGESIEKKHIDGFSAFPNSDVVCSMMIGELGSPKSIVR
jgi:transformation/transcription domain-associated protein